MIERAPFYIDDFITGDADEFDEDYDADSGTEDFDYCDHGIPFDEDCIDCEMDYDDEFDE